MDACRTEAGDGHERSTPFATQHRANTRVAHINHALLPAFVGARPYHQAHERGVKEIGATAHYVTAELDQGPIIAQKSVNIEHLGPCPTTAQLVTEGRTTEASVLVTALTRHCQGELLRYRGRTVRISA